VFGLRGEEGKEGKGRVKEGQREPSLCLDKIF